MTKPLDHQGKPISDGETDDTEIIVWEIEPSLYSGYVSLIVRDYHKAVTLVHGTVTMMMDDEDEEMPLVVTIKHRKITLGEYNEIMENNY